jgi:ribosomal protein L31E
LESFKEKHVEVRNSPLTNDIDNMIWKLSDEEFKSKFSVQIIEKLKELRQLRYWMYDWSKKESEEPVSKSNRKKDK